MNKIISSNATYTSTYIIEHTIAYPDNILDYDYESNNRFPLTYIHSINIYDGIMNQLIHSITLPTETAAELINRLYEVILSNDIYNLFNRDSPIKIHTISKDVVLYIYYDANTLIAENNPFSSNDPNIIVDAFDNSGFNTKLRFKKSEVEKILDMISTDPIMEDMFVAYL